MRNKSKFEALAASLDVPYRVFSPSDAPETIDKALQGMKLLANGAGPFKATSSFFMDACIRNKVHYIDRFAELHGFLSVEERDLEAKAAGVMLLPVVCTGLEAIMDCVGARLLDRVSTPAELEQVLDLNGPLS